MVKLFTDEEMDEKCKDYDPIPMKVAQDVLHRKEDPDKVNILNGVIKSPYRIGQPPANVNMYASQIGMMTPISADKFLSEYNKFVGRKIIEQEKEIEQRIDESIQTDPEEKPKRVRRTKQEVTEARTMDSEDIDAGTGTADIETSTSSVDKEL